MAWLAAQWSSQVDRVNAIGATGNGEAILAQGAMTGICAVSTLVSIVLHWNAFIHAGS